MKREDLDKAINAINKEQKPTLPMAIPFPLSSAAKMMTVTAME